MGLWRIFVEETLETGVCCRELTLGERWMVAPYIIPWHTASDVYCSFGGVFQNFRWGGLISEII
jgi:hypothetical protein